MPKVKLPQIDTEACEDATHRAERVCLCLQRLVRIEQLWLLRNATKYLRRHLHLLPTLGLKRAEALT